MPEILDADMPSILRTILSDKANRLAVRKRELPEQELLSRCRDLAPPLDFLAALDRTPRPSLYPGNHPGDCPDNHPAEDPAADTEHDNGIAIIAEFKRRSPSRGEIRRHFELSEIHEAYKKGGADAYSVLTEEDHFGGCLEDLKRLRELAEVPLLRKDFLFEPYQIYESRSAGADALLLIVAALEDSRLGELIDLGRELGVEALVEVHTREELRRALAAGARIVGINNRDLHSFQVDLEVSLHLAGSVPEGISVVSESGIHGPEDIRRLLRAGIRAFLIGEQLIKAADPAAELQALKRVG